MRSLSLALLLGFFVQSHAQSWTKVHPTYAAAYADIHAFSATSVVVCGDDGMIAATTNGGLSWDVRPTSTRLRLNALHFFDATKGWAVGDSGLVLQTTNGGTSWNKVSSGTALNLYDVFFATATTGFAVGEGICLRSSDGGLTWTPIPSLNGFTMKAVSFVSAQQGYISGLGGLIYRSLDGGTTWALLPPTVVNNINAVSFRTAAIGVAVGDLGTVLLTTDSGSTWTLKALDPNYLIRDVRWLDATTLIAVGEHAVNLTGVVLRSVNSGQNWGALSTGPSNPLNAMALAGGLVFVGGMNRTVGLTSDEGVNWSSWTNFVFDLNTSDFSGEDQAYAQGGNRDLAYALKSADAGLTWFETSLPSVYPIEAVWMTSLDSGLAVGQQGSTMVTANGTQLINNWSPAGAPASSDPLYALTRSPAGRFYAAGGSSTTSKLYTSLTYGSTWSALTVNFGGPIHDLVFTSPDTAFLCGGAGGSGFIYRSTNAGLSWNLVHSAPNVLYGLSFRNGVGLAVGEVGQLLRSTNGTQWMSQSVPTTQRLSDVAFLKPAVAMAVGGTPGPGGGTAVVLLSTDSGQTWTSMEPDTRNPLTSISVWDSTLAVATGLNGTVLRFEGDINARKGLQGLMDLHLSPNPSQGGWLLRWQPIQWSFPVELTVTDATGRVLHANRMDPLSATPGEYRIDTLDWPLGVYTLVLRDAMGRTASLRGMVGR